VDVSMGETAVNRKYINKEGSKTGFFAVNFYLWDVLSLGEEGR
jgi:hypothetical protein